MPLADRNLIDAQSERKGECSMANRGNYGAEKRQKERKKQKKREEKLLRKQQKKLQNSEGEPGIGDDEQEVKADDVVEPGSEKSEDGSR